MTNFYREYRIGIIHVLVKVNIQRTHKLIVMKVYKHSNIHELYIKCNNSDIRALHVGSSIYYSKCWEVTPIYNLCEQEKWYWICFATSNVAFLHPLNCVLEPLPSNICLILPYREWWKHY